MTDENADKDSQRLFEAYQARYKDSQRVLILILGYGLLFFFVVVISYDSLINDAFSLHSIKFVLAVVSPLIDWHNNIYLGYLSTLNQTQINNMQANQTRTELANYEHINDLIPRIKQLPSIVLGNLTNLVLNLPSDSRCIQSLEIQKWINCNITALTGKLSNKTITTQQIYINNLNELEHKINQTLDRVVGKDKETHQIYPGISERYINQARDIITESSSNLTSFRKTIEIAKSNPLASIYPPKYPELARVIQHLKTVKEKLEGNETTFIDTRQQLTNKFEQLQAPFFGKIPVGLDDAIVAFPIILSLGFLVYSFLLVDTLDVRDRFYNAYKKQDPPIHIIAPIWIDPKRRKRDQILPFTVISIPAVIFGVTVGLIIYVWYGIPFHSDPALLGTEYHIVYLFLYALGSVFFACGYYRITSRLGYFNALILKLKSLGKQRQSQI